MRITVTLFSAGTKAKYFMRLVKERSGLVAVPFFVMIYYQMILCREQL